tara:strand:- start:916 stop:1065 length:150 start_codon:yes stop_codon:yes gene_type:complete
VITFSEWRGYPSGNSDHEKDKLPKKIDKQTGSHTDKKSQVIIFNRFSHR